MDTALDSTSGRPDPPPGQCWCCGTTDDPARTVHLGNHPEVALCLPCVRWAAKEAWEIEDRDRTGVVVGLRDRFRRLRRGVIDHHWHRHPIVGRPLRWLGRHLP
jgi:hypothetical protein